MHLRDNGWAALHYCANMIITNKLNLLRMSGLILTLKQMMEKYSSYCRNYGHLNLCKAPGTYR